TKTAMMTIRTRMIEKNHFRMRLNIKFLTIEMGLQASWIQVPCLATIAQRFNAGFANAQPISPVQGQKSGNSYRSPWAFPVSTATFASARSVTETLPNETAVTTSRCHSVRAGRVRQSQHRRLEMARRLSLAARFELAALRR